MVRLAKKIEEMRHAEKNQVNQLNGASRGLGYTDPQEVLKSAVTKFRQSLAFDSLYGDVEVFVRKLSNHPNKFLGNVLTVLNMRFAPKKFVENHYIKPPMPKDWKPTDAKYVGQLYQIPVGDVNFGDDETVYLNEQEGIIAVRDGKVAVYGKFTPDFWELVSIETLPTNK